MSTELADDFLASTLPEKEAHGEVVLTDPAKADKLVWKIDRLKDEQHRIVRFTKQQIEELQAFEERKILALQGQIDWLSGVLERYVRAEYDRSAGKTRSIDLPHGKLQLRAQPETYTYDDGKILGWAKKRGATHLYRTQRVVLRPEVKKFVKTSGEIPDGVTIEPAGEPKFYIQFKEEDNGARDD